MKKPVRFIQTLPSFSEADAIGNHVRAIHALLLSQGYDALISATFNHCPMNVLPSASLKKFIDPKRDIVIHHMATGDDLNEEVAQYPFRKKVMIYHNITPPRFFEFCDLHSLNACAFGKKQLKKLKDAFDLSIAVSDYNAEELREIGYKNVVTVPLLVDFARYDKLLLSVRTVLQYDNEKFNILFVGRGAPNKCQHDIVAAFARFRRYCPNSRLLLAGGWLDSYQHHVRKLITELHLEDSIVILGTVSDAELKTFYQLAHLFLCMSEHEGFCVPLLEAMYFGVPILAFAVAAVPYTLGDSGVLFYEKDFDAVAKMMALMVEDAEMRKKIVSAQKNRLADFRAERVRALLLEQLTRIEQ